MRVVIEPTAELYRLAARRVARAVRAKPDCVLGLATGRTMVPLYDELVRLHREEGLSFAAVTAFHLDEYVGVAPDQPGSFRRFVRERLEARTDLRPDAVRFPDAAAPDPAAAARAYEAELRAAGGIDLQLLGLGVNAHIGFNEPGSSLASRTRVKTLSDETLAANREGLPAIVRERRLAITMGLGTILDARLCLCIATGAAKAGAVAALVEGPVTASAPGSVLQLHPDVIAYVDEAAAAGLLRRRYYLDAEARERALEARPSGDESGDVR
jgi:glucosamine-6-phosphate deaminase